MLKTHAEKHCKFSSFPPLFSLILTPKGLLKMRSKLPKIVLSTSKPLHAAPALSRKASEAVKAAQDGPVSSLLASQSVQNQAQKLEKR